MASLNRPDAKHSAAWNIPNLATDLAEDSTQSSILHALPWVHHESEALEVDHRRLDLQALYRDPNQHDGGDRLPLVGVYEAHRTPYQ